MVKFSCFNAHGHSQKPKKPPVQLSEEAMQNSLQGLPQSQASIVHMKKVQGDTLVGDDAIMKHVSSSSSIDRGWKSGEINSKLDIDTCSGAHHQKIRSMRKSMSLGRHLDQKGMFSGDNSSDEEPDINFSCNDSRGHRDGGSKDLETGPPSDCQEAPILSDVMNHHESVFSSGDAPQYEKEDLDNSDTHFSSDHMPRTPPSIVKSKSLPNLTSADGPSTLKHLAHRTRSSEDLHMLGLRQKEAVVHKIGRQVENQERDDYVSNNEKNNRENPSDSCDPYNYIGSVKDWIVPVMNEAKVVKNYQGESSVPQMENLTSRDFKIKRIEEWVVDLQHCSPVEELDNTNVNNKHAEKGAIHLDARLDAKATAGMEAAKKYISSLSAAATTVQLANHGLVMIPFLSAFVSLKTLNLSGNSIARITAGTLPRGLHILNLSKNNISSIEGLRELTRLRILNLSYNRIVRIGHGLASCSSLKELYLAGNKISEVEGLHRLLKLNVLDLRYNKISTAKCLGQLAANYNSLQAISLEGNPAQKNVGDEQLKKYLQGLLPHLSYFNRQSIKAGTLKDTSDHHRSAARLGPQIDRGGGLRIDHKNNMRKGMTTATTTHGIAGTSHNKSVTSSSIHGRKSAALASLNKGRYGHLPPTSGSSKAATSGNHHHRQHHNQLYELGNKLLSFKSDLSMRRSRSEGTLAAL